MRLISRHLSSTSTTTPVARLTMKSPIPNLTDHVYDVPAHLIGQIRYSPRLVGSVSKADHTFTKLNFDFTPLRGRAAHSAGAQRPGTRSVSVKSRISMPGKPLGGIEFSTVVSTMLTRVYGCRQAGSPV